MAYGQEYSSVASGLYYYPIQVGLLGAMTFSLAFSEAALIITAAIAISALLLTILMGERAPLVGLLFGLLPLFYYIRSTVKEPETYLLC